MSGAALQNLAGSAEQQRRMQDRPLAITSDDLRQQQANRLTLPPIYGPDEVRATGDAHRLENRLRAIPFYGHEDPSRYRATPFHIELPDKQLREEDGLKKLNYNYGLLRKRWESKHIRELGYYDFCRKEMEKVDKLRFPPFSISPLKSPVPPVVTPLMKWMDDHWKDLFFIQADGSIEVIIRVRLMLEQRILSNPQMEMFYEEWPSSYLVFNRFKNTGFEEETDEDYQKIIIGTVLANVLPTSFSYLKKEPLNPGRVIVIKGVQDTTMNFRFDDYLEYHWVPEGVGEGFKP